MSEPEDSTPGQCLRAGREEQQLSVREVAAQLHLREEMIHALEADEYGQFASVTYATGYIRAYARLLSLNDEALIQGFYLHNPELKPHLEPMIRYRARQLSNLDKPILFLNWLIGLTVLVLIVLWYRSHYGPDDGVDVPPGDEFPVSLDEPLDPLPVLNLPDTVDRWTTPTDGMPPAMGFLVGPFLVFSVLDDAVATPVAPGPTAIMGPPVALSSLPLLEVELNEGESWLEIYDSRQERLFFGLVRTGFLQTFTGEAPFELVLGRANVVRVYYRGEPVPLADHIGPSGSARLRLPLQ